MTKKDLSYKDLSYIVTKDRLHNSGLILCMICLNMSVYYGTRLITDSLPHHSMETVLDGYIPLVPWFSLIYLLAYFQWALVFILVAFQEKKVCEKVAFSEMTAKILTFACFVLYPTFIIRPEITGTDFFSRLTAFIYSCDIPVNLFPSIHCLESWMCCRALNETDAVSGKYKIVNFVFSLFVFASTVLIKQHVVLDIAGGILAVETGLFIVSLIQDRKNRQSVKEMVKNLHSGFGFVFSLAVFLGLAILTGAVS